MAQKPALVTRDMLVDGRRATYFAVTQRRLCVPSFGPSIRLTSAHFASLDIPTTDFINNPARHPFNFVSFVTSDAGGQGDAALSEVFASPFCAARGGGLLFRHEVNGPLNQTRGYFLLRDSCFSFLFAACIAPCISGL